MPGEYQKYELDTDIANFELIVHPAEENASGSTYTTISNYASLLTLQPGITDKVAKESKDSNASTHELHDSEEANQATSGGSAHANAHKANPVRTAGWLDNVQWRLGLTTRQGPVHADNLPTPESKADLKKRAEELNK
jgi:hypothetical protein